MNVFRLVLFVSLLISFPALATQLTLVLKDTENKPVKDVVAALVPAVSEELAGTPPAEMDQREKMFMPHVLAIKVNTLVRFPNSDDIRHHVYSFSPAKKFELRLYHGSTAEPVLFDKPGTVVLGCNIHDSMVAYIYVLETNYFAVSDEQGKLQINAPGGRTQRDCNGFATGRQPFRGRRAPRSDDLAHLGADRHGILARGDDDVEGARDRRLDLLRALVALHRVDRLAGFDRRAIGHQPFGDSPFFHAHAQLGEEEFGCHGMEIP